MRAKTCCTGFLAILLAALGVSLGCDSADGDGDVDVDADGDADTDVDGDSDGDGDCAAVDELCDPTPCCDDSHMCAGNDTEGYYCLAPCTPSLCTTGHAPPLEGICENVSMGGDVGGCIYGGLGAVSCVPGAAEDCTTEYGVPGVCVPDPSGATFCLERCTPVVTGCDSAHICAPLDEPSGGVEGVCLPGS